MAAALAVLVAAEIGARVAGLVDFPLYVAGPPLGYVPAPTQHGAFLDKYDWAFNEHGMGVAAPFAPGAGMDTVLIGDSLVYGGNAYRQAEKLGPQLQHFSGGQVWPVGAGSWALANELAYLDAHPDVAQGADQFVFVLNSADLSPLSVWRSELTHPTHPALSALAYLAERVVASRLPAPAESPAQVTRAWEPDWRRLVAAGKPIRVVLYPTRDEAADPALWAQARQPFAQLAAPNVTFLDVAKAPNWAPTRYKDSIHPTPEGMAELARVIGGGGRASASH
jgi:lysophospholipase L1-like esterase